jgi:hypothetical protein
MLHGHFRNALIFTIGKPVEKQPESYSLEINSQLKILDRLHRAEAIAFKLFYQPKSDLYDYIRNSIQGELEISWDQLLKLADPKKRKTSNAAAEAMGEISERINYDLNQLLIQMAMLQDAFRAIEKMEVNQKDAAQTCWISIQSQILDLRKKVLEKVPEELKLKVPDHESQVPQDSLHG